MSPESAIADVMIQALPDLSARWELEVWCPSEANYRPCPVRVRPFAEADADVLNALAKFDLVIYVLGNSPWHSRILPLAQSLPGLVILHDASLTDLVRQTAIETGALESLLARVEADSGPENAAVLRHPGRAVAAGEWLQFCANVPLDEVATSGSLGAVVHSQWHAKRIDGRTLGDVTVAPLPVPSTRLGFEKNQSAGSSLLLNALPEEALLLVTLGSVNSNRHIDRLLMAIADDDLLSSRLHLWAVGAAEEKARADLLRLARRLGLKDRFAVTGRVTDALLHEILERADIAAALRDPVLEGQSASVLTQMLSGTPIVVYDHAHYSELPDDVVLKVDLEDALAGVRNALRRLVDDESERVRLGEHARDYVLRSRSGAAYAAALLEAGERALATKPLAHLSADLGAHLRRLGLQKEPAVVEAVSDLAFELFNLG